uniref:Uncharacterized protein n=1 Tax=Arundo donax TaxID=35708 RepID=A0A0A8ZF68_ARUDO
MAAHQRHPHRWGIGSCQHRLHPRWSRPQPRHHLRRHLRRPPLQLPPPSDLLPLPQLLS